MAKQKSKPRLPEVTDMQLELWLSGHDLELFTQQATRSTGREKLCQELQCTCSAGRFDDAVTAHCRWWLKKRVLPEKAGETLTDEEWERQCRAVRRLQPELQGQPFQVALMLVRTEIRTSPTILRNLSSSHRVWSDR